MKNVLFVCTGNTCRSPLAEAIFEHKKAVPNLEAKSAGVHAIAGTSISEGSKSALKNRGVPVNHTAKMVDKELADWSDVILTMTEGHKQLVIERFPERSEKVFTLKEFIYDDEETQAKIENIQQHIVQLEVKRASFVAQNQGKIDEYNETNEVSGQGQLEEEILDQLKPEQEAIEKLQEELPSFDIQDPFGASVEVYDATLVEIEEAIDKLLKKLSD